MKSKAPCEFRVTALRECPLPEKMLLCDTPDGAVGYWRLHIETGQYFNPDIECFAVLMLNTRRRVKGHQLVSFGTLDTILVHPREVFRAAVIAGAAAVILMHNHPSGEPNPSEADIKVTRDLVRAGQILNSRSKFWIMSSLADPASAHSVSWDIVPCDGSFRAQRAILQKSKESLFFTPTTRHNRELRRKI